MSDTATRGTFQVADANDGKSTTTEESSGGWGNIASDIWGGLKKAKDVVVDKGGDVIENVTEEVGKIDGKKLLEQGKDVGDKIVKGVQGKSGTELDPIIDEASEWIPGVGMVQEGARLIDKSNVLEEGESELTRDDVKEAVKKAGPEFIGIPQGVRDAQNVERILNKTGISDTVVETVKKATEEGGDGQLVTEGEGDEKNGLQPMKLIDSGLEKRQKVFWSLPWWQ